MRLPTALVLATVRGVFESLARGNGGAPIGEENAMAEGFIQTVYKRGEFWQASQPTVCGLGRTRPSSTTKPA
jgi:hypothetical protein